MIDLRSDTVTKPTPEMRRAMAEAEVGDDVLGDDPTVNELERKVAEILGKEAAVYVPSGTMANQTALRAQTSPGDEIILDITAHMYNFEGGASAALSGATCRHIQGKRGIFTAAQLENALRPINYHYPRTRLVVVENTSNRGGGSIWPIETIEEVADVARANSLLMHLDGARIWNATAATGIPESEYASFFDSVSVCFSKGLGAPVGSALAGDTDLIDRARRFRKMFGGGMRQAGIIASGALFALGNNRGRLTEDHDNAKMLAEGIADLPGIELNTEDVETNIVIFGVSSIPAAELVEKLREKEVLVLATAPDKIRAVTNLGVDSEGIALALSAFRSILK